MTDGRQGRKIFDVLLTLSEHPSEGTVVDIHLMACHTCA